MKITKETFEKLAAIEHARWARWQAYVFSKGSFDACGQFTLPVDLVARWHRQIETDYTNLSESEKESDRKEVHEYLKVLGIEVEADAGQ
jgi:hypothetical protein